MRKLSRFFYPSRSRLYPASRIACQKKDNKMCLFPRKNKNIDSKAYAYGITHFSCGVCPECLSQKSRYWSLRCGMQAKQSQGMMLTLTYDTYKYDKQGNIIGENIPNRDLKVEKKHVQNFFKRLRHYFPNKKISYLATAEYGKSTGRAHYHVLLFGLLFDDLRTYKKSKRGNTIYKSPTLDKIWQGGRSEIRGGICTVDCVNINSAVARYCTKYCAKDSGVDDTFMLFSRGIGEEMLRSKFNGKNYWLDGHEYSVPKSVWKWYIRNKYNLSEDYTRYIPLPQYDKKLSQQCLQPMYKNYVKDFEKYLIGKKLNEIYSVIRDNDEVYSSYVEYWKNKNKTIDKYKKSERERILSLDSKKYWSYKQKALLAFDKYSAGRCFKNPRKTKSMAHNREALGAVGALSKSGYMLGEARSKVVNTYKKLGIEKYLPLPPCHITANDSPHVTSKKIMTCNGEKRIFFIPQSWKKGELNPFLEKIK